MGCTQSSASAEHSRSRALDARVENDHEQDRLRVKLLLLGAGESGKSTLFKQMRILYGKGWSDGERKAFAPIIAGNVLSSMRTLCQKASELGNVLEPAVRDAAAMVAALPEGSRSLDAHMARAVAALWADDGIRATFAARARFQLLDSAPYYLNKVTELAAPGYIPTTEDVLKSRVQTTSVVEETFVIDGVPFTIIDVGGQRNERKKWIHQFDAVTAVIFVASLSEYDQCLAEDGSVNRMVEAMELFAEVANSKWFVNSSIILFLNKRDLFEEKIRGVDLRHEGGDGSPPRFLDYTGGCNAEAAKQYIQDRFLELRVAGGGGGRKGRQQQQRERPIYPHVTCATDTSNVRLVFNVCKETILHENLKASGFAAE